MQDQEQASRQLNKAGLASIQTIPTPAPDTFSLPEKVIQFGTGVLLRGLPDYYIDKANKANLFNGRVVVVKSTAQNRSDDFKDQDGLYTLCMRGWQAGKPFSEDLLNSSVSRVIDAVSNWPAVLQVASNPDIEIAISNTTEVGITLDKSDDLHSALVPKSFPGKLVAFLHQRFEHFQGDPDKGLVIIPTELIADNGQKLKSICIELSQINQLPASFIDWLKNHNEFCDSLVDRIVAGKMPPEAARKEAAKLGYTDELMIMSEVYGLWAIQTSNQAAADRLSFSQADPGVIVTENIEKYRHTKLFLLNAPHTFTCVIAQALGFEFVNKAMADPRFEAYIRQLLFKEIVPAVVGEQTSQSEAESFAEDVIDRFKNPFIDHRWKDISKQMTLKMTMRCLPLIQEYEKRFAHLPPLMVKGFAAYLLFLKTGPDGSASNAEENSQYQSRLNGHQLEVTDAKAAALQSHWQTAKDTQAAIAAILRDQQIWSTDLTAIPGLEEAVYVQMEEMDQGQHIKI